jgi:cytochrome c553
MPELHAEAPDLIGVGSRLNDAWVYQWLLNPRVLRSTARMPRLFSLNPTEAERQQASDIVEYLSSLKREPEPGSFFTVSMPPNWGSLKLGLTLWDDLGCLGCHRREFAGNTDVSDGRSSLIFAYDKFGQRELTRFLLKPQRHFAWSRMPDFNLSPEEATALSRAIIEGAKQDDQRPELRVHRPKGDAARGQKLFASLGCRQCHRVSPDEPLPKPHLPSLFGKAIARGCLAEPVRTSSPRSPDFHFEPAERAALLALLRGEERPLASDSPTDVSRRFVAELKCVVCHPRDGRMSTLPEILAEEGASGRAPEVLPNLTWTGEKLHAPWIQSLLAGQIAERPRPWMKLRMPSFPARAGLLANGFAREHGLSSDPVPRPSPEPELAEIGEALATRTGLLDCRQCHPIGLLSPTGDKSTLLAPGINFALTRERLRHDFYRRFTLEPPRYDVTTRMPKLAVDGRSTKVQNIFDGDARQQFDAVWHYLQTVPSETSDP